MLDRGDGRLLYFSSPVSFIGRRRLDIHEEPLFIKQALVLDDGEPYEEMEIIVLHRWSYLLVYLIIEQEEQQPAPCFVLILQHYFLLLTFLFLFCSLVGCSVNLMGLSLILSPALNLTHFAALK